MATIGYDTEGATPIGFGAGQLRGFKYTAALSFTAVRMKVYESQNWIVGREKTLGIYADSSGVPGALLAQTGPIISVAELKWYSSNLDAPVSIVNGTPYWIAQFNKEFTQQWFDAGGTGRARTIPPAYTGTLPDPFGITTGSSYLLSLYAQGFGFGPFPTHFRQV